MAMRSKNSKKTAKKSSISKALRDAIREQQLTAYAAANSAGVSVDAVQRFLNEERGLTLATVDKLAASLGLKLCSDSKRPRP